MTTPAQDGKSISALAVDLFGSIDERLSNHGRALASTMQDLSALRGQVSEFRALVEPRLNGIDAKLVTLTETQAAHTQALQQIQATLTALVERG